MSNDIQFPPRIVPLFPPDFVLPPNLTDLTKAHAFHMSKPRETHDIPLILAVVDFELVNKIKMLAINIDGANSEEHEAAVGIRV
jgi:hypothetical protein